MYESFFELDQRPFPATPLASRYFAADLIELARTALVRCIDRAEGAGLIVGPPGTGKTLLCYLLAEHFKSQFSVALLFSGNLTTRRELLQAILFELGLPYRGMEEGELRLALIDHLTRGERCLSGMLLLVDEAHTLPLKLLEEVRMITNIMRQGQPRVRLVLAGNPALEEHLASPKLAALSQRLAARCYLESLDRSETANYMQSHLAAVAGEPDRIFKADAQEAVYRATDGIPRLVNQLCDQAMLLAFSLGRRQVDAALVETAWANLQQLPMPGNAGAVAADKQTRPANAVIEFGHLDDVVVGDLAEGEFLPLTDPSPANAARTLPLLHLAEFDEPLDTLEDDFARPASVPEVELVFDESDLDTNAGPHGSAEAWQSVSTSQTPHHPASVTAGYTVCDEPFFQPILLARSQADLQGGADVFKEDAVEEIIVDRYAALDALKGLPGSASRQHRVVPLVKVPAETAASAAGKAQHAVEKSLTLAEALMRHATAKESSELCSGPCSADAFSVVAAQQPAAGNGSAGWMTVDLLARSQAVPLVSPDAPAPPKPPVPQAAPLSNNAASAGIAADSEPPQFRPLQIEPSTIDDRELELIVVEDDVLECTLRPAAPQVEPVRRQEYRQLFARLRKG